MSRKRAPRLLVVSPDAHLPAAADWTLQRGGSDETCEWIPSAADVPDQLTLRARDGAIPLVVVIDLRKRAVAGVQLLRWIAANPGIGHMVVVALTAGATHAPMLHGLGADLVTHLLPDAAKLRQLLGIAAELRRLPGRFTDPDVSRAAERAWEATQRAEQARN